MKFLQHEEKRCMYQMLSKNLFGEAILGNIVILKLKEKIQRNPPNGKEDKETER